MRLIKQQTTNTRSITGKGLKYYPSGQIASIDANVLVVAQGPSSTRPSTPVNGSVRYNTDTQSFEFYVDSQWQVVRYKEPGIIYRQYLGDGDGVSTIFGPLNSTDPDYPVPQGPDNIFVFVENVFQLSIINFNLITNPATPGIGAEIDAFYIVNGNEYVITSPGTTDFVRIGAENSLQGTIFTADTTYKQTLIQSFRQPEKQESTDFARHIAAQNSTTPLIIAGVPYYDEPTNTAAGRVYIFSYDGNIGTGSTLAPALYEIPNPSVYATNAGDHFGQSVAINSTYAAVGAPDEDDNAGLGQNPGKVFLYNLSGLDSTNVSANLPTFQIDNPDVDTTNRSDRFGTKVSMSETHLLVCALTEDAGLGITPGTAYLYEIANISLPNTNANVTNIPAPNTSQVSFGRAQSISSRWIALSGKSNSTTNWTVYIYDLQNFNPTSPTHTITNPYSAPINDDDYFGETVAVNDQYLVIGARGYDNLADPNPLNQTDVGAVFVYDLLSATPTVPLYTNFNPNVYGTGNSDNFGSVVGISTAYYYGSCEEESHPDGTLSGVVYAFDIQTGQLVGTHFNPNAFDTPASDIFGDGLFVTDYHVIAGAPGENDSTIDNLGYIYVYEVQGTALGTGVVRPTGTYVSFTNPVNNTLPVNVIHNFDK